MKFVFLFGLPIVLIFYLFVLINEISKGDWTMLIITAFLLIVIYANDDTPFSGI
jgi:hypothetical protein